MSSLEKKFSDPWLTREESCQTDDDTGVEHTGTDTETDRRRITSGGADSGYPSEETVGGYGSSIGNVDNWHGSKASVASSASSGYQTSGQTKQSCRKVAEEISDPWRRERKVVVAVDGSDHSDRALDFYLDSLHKMEYEIVLTHCADIPRIPLCDEIPREEWNTELNNKDKSIKLLEEDYAAKLRNEGVNFSTRFFYHPKPACGILQVAEEANAAFIVTGSRGLGRKRRTVLGSVSDYVVHHSKLPVVICPAEQVHHRYHYDRAAQVIKSRFELDLIQESEDIPKMRLSADNLSSCSNPEENPSPGLKRHSFVLVDI